MVPMPLVSHCLQEMHTPQRQGSGDSLPAVRPRDTADVVIEDHRVAWTMYCAAGQVQDGGLRYVESPRDEPADVAKAVQELSHVCGCSLEDLSGRLHDKRQRRYAICRRHHACVCVCVCVCVCARV